MTRCAWNADDDSLGVVLPDIDDFMSESQLVFREARLEKLPGKFSDKEAFPDYSLSINGVKYEATDDVSFKAKNRNAARWSTGHVLMVGMGLGVAIMPIIERRCVKDLTILEEHADVAKLMGGFWLKQLAEEQKKRVQILTDITDLKGTFDYAIFKEQQYSDYRDYMGVPCLVFFNNQLINANLLGDDKFYASKES